MKRLVILYLIGGLCLPLSAQSFLNGSFEKSRISCNINMPNKEFNNSMANTVAFGSADQCDILDKNCGWGNPKDGKKFIGMAEFEHKSDELSMELNAPLTEDTVYTISCFIKKSSSHKPCIIEVGCSSTATSFGDKIGFIKPAESEEWMERRITFTSPNNGRYITLRVIRGGDGWNELDNFTFVGGVAPIDPSGADAK